MKKNLRAGLIGLGVMGQHHARVLANLPGVDFVGVSDPLGDPQSLSQGRPVVKCVSELIALGLDYAMVAVPTIHHLEIGSELSRAGIWLERLVTLNDITLPYKKLAGGLNN